VAEQKSFFFFFQEKSVKVYGKSGKAPHILLPTFPEKKKKLFLPGHFLRKQQYDMTPTCDQQHLCVARYVQSVTP
jgi:hypothetical protein